MDFLWCVKKSRGSKAHATDKDFRMTNINPWLCQPKNPDERPEQCYGQRKKNMTIVLYKRGNWTKKSSKEAKIDSHLNTWPLYIFLPPTLLVSTIVEYTLSKT